METNITIESENARSKRCVRPWSDIENAGNFTMCEGEGCMGWVQELDETGKPTGRGRCGMVYPVLQSYTCTTAPEYDGSMSIMDWKNTME